MDLRQPHDRSGVLMALCKTVGNGTADHPTQQEAKHRNDDS
jgi:hypothetical protein